ncbi:programmed cell death 1 ligand 1-like [Lycodopsis pacificus]
MTDLKRNILLLLMMIYSLDTVSCVEEAEASTGGDVLLKCVYDMKEPLLAPFSVFWRDKDDNNVLDIRGSKEDRKGQNEMFKDRVFSEEKLYEKGNFSIQMKDVRRSDSGLYDCTIPGKFKQSVRLTVTDKRVGATGPGPSDGSSSVTPIFSWFCIFFFSLSHFYL